MTNSFPKPPHLRKPLLKECQLSGNFSTPHNNNNNNNNKKEAEQSNMNYQVFFYNNVRAMLLDRAPRSTVTKGTGFQQFH